VTPNEADSASNPPARRRDRVKFMKRSSEDNTS
jgi:hypothetical protein